LKSSSASPFATLQPDSGSPPPSWGDDPRWDVAGAEQAGIRPLLLAPNAAVSDAVESARNLREVLDHLLPGGA